MQIKCSKCGGETMKVGKITGIASVQSLNSKTGLGGSELLITFCADCGEVMGMKVKDPDKIK